MAIDNSNERQAFIHLVSYWRGYIRNKDLQTQFSVSRQQAYNDIRDYMELNPNFLQKADNGVFVGQDRSGPAEAIPSLDDYFDWLLTGHFYLKSHTLQLGLAEEVKAQSRRISRQVVSLLTQAIEQKRRLEMGYISLTSPEFDGRIFHPHTFVKTGQRWHVRGYCEKSQDYRDLVLSRCRGEIELLDQSTHTQEQDTVWNTLVEIILGPDPRLTPEQQEVLINDYHMSDGRLVIRTRAAIVNYLLKDMQVNTKYLDGVPEAQQLILVNRNDIKGWLFDG